MSTQTMTTNAPTAGTYDLDPSHTDVAFTARHMMFSKVRGTFTSFSGTFTVAEDLSGSSIDVSIDAASFKTGDDQRDGHVKSGDFLDVETYPTITFSSDAVQHVEGDQYEVPGTLTIKDVSRPVTLDVTYLGSGTDPFGNVRAGFTAATEIDREDFGITWNQALETGGVLVGKKVAINLDVQGIPS